MLARDGAKRGIIHRNDLQETIEKGYTASDKDFDVLTGDYAMMTNDETEVVQLASLLNQLHSKAEAILAETMGQRNAIRELMTDISTEVSRKKLRHRTVSIIFWMFEGCMVLLFLVGIIRLLFDDSITVLLSIAGFFGAFVLRERFGPDSPPDEYGIGQITDKRLKEMRQKIISKMRATQSVSK